MYARLSIVITPLKRFSSGFSLVELLVVAGVLAALGTAILFAINPSELRKRSRDAVRLEDAKTIHSAVLRYNSGENCFPWQKHTNGTCSRTRTLSATYLSPTSFGTGNYNFSALISRQELKSNFIQHSSVANLELVVSYDTTASRFSVCFTPESKFGRKGGMGKVMDRSNTTEYASCDNSYTRNESNCNICIP